MRVLDEMFLVVSDDERQTVLRLNGSHPVFAVHFPGMPITPGVCLVQMLGELLSRHEGRELELSRIVNLKFVQTVRPVAAAGGGADDGPLLTVSFSSVADTGEGLQAKGTIAAGGEVTTKFSLVFR